MPFRRASSEIKSNRPLHHTWRSGRARRAESVTGLSDLAQRGRCATRRVGAYRVVCQDSPGRAGSATRQSTHYSIGREDHGPVPVAEIRVIEDIVDFPAELDFTPLAQLDVLEDGHVVVEDGRLTHEVSRHVADQARRPGLAEAGRINRIR